MREHAIRLAILRDLRCLTGAPITCRELAEISDEPALHYNDLAPVEREWRELCALGYIEAVPGFGGHYCRLTPKGRQQLLPDFPQDPFIHGPGAAR